MSKLRVGFSGLTNTIYAGTVNAKGIWGANKTDVTNDAIGSVILLRLALGGASMVINDETGHVDYVLEAHDVRGKQLTEADISVGKHRQSTWIPCSERMPDNPELEYYWVKLRDESVVICKYDSMWKKFYFIRNELDADAVHWMPLPEPPACS